jgi:hypothetical protein
MSVRPTRIEMRERRRGDGIAMEVKMEDGELSLKVPGKVVDMLRRNLVTALADLPELTLSRVQTR